LTTVASLNGDWRDIDYKFLDGIRGLGAFIVYINHFFCEFEPFVKPKDPNEIPKTPKWL
jgi:hypothetical protein